MILKFFLLIFFVTSKVLACPLTISPSVNVPYSDSDHGSKRAKKTKMGLMTEELFNQAMDKIEQVYVPLLAPAGIKFSVDRRYGSTHKNLHPQRNRNSWIIEMHGGFFKDRLYETYEVLVTSACHEIGHHLGETVYYPFLYSWSAGEGQADYYATLKCLRKVFEDEDNLAWLANYSGPIPEVVTQKCQEAWSGDSERHLCIRAAIASYHFINSFAVAEFERPDSSIATKLSYEYPSAQCRLDTFFQGALCEVDHRIPTSKTDKTAGNCNIKTGQVLGVRPRCWYVEN